MIILIKGLQVVLALSILIVVHEFGHFFFSKLFGIRVDKFFLFFDAGGVKLLSTKEGWFSKLFPKAKDWETEYGIGWLPLGGYCKVAGMIDESMDTEHLKNDPQPWEFRSKAAWQRLLVMFGGVLFNFIFAIIMYSVLLANWGESHISNQNKQIYVNELAYDMGFRNGDHIISFDDYVPESFFMLQVYMARETASKAVVLRDNDTINIYIDHNRIGEILSSPGMFSLAIPFIVDGISEESPNIDSGLQDGDRIIGLSGISTPFVQDAWKTLEANAGSTIEADILRCGDTLKMNLQVDTTGKLGVMLQQIEYETKEYGFLSSIPAGFKKTFSTIGGYFKDLKLVATPSTEAYKSVGSVISIGQLFPSTWDWYSFISILALLSIMLGVMNILPIPALDGGHILFTLYEIITGKKPSDNFLYIAQIIGLLLVFGLIFLSFGNDIAKIIRMFR